MMSCTNFAGLCVVNMCIELLADEHFQMSAFDSYQYPFASFAEYAEEMWFDLLENGSDVQTCLLIVGETNKIVRIDREIIQQIRKCFEKLANSNELVSFIVDASSILSVTEIVNLYMNQLMAFGELRFPLHTMIDCGEGVSALCLFSSENAHVENNVPPEAAKLWIAREQPWLEGKQVMTRSYKFEKFIGRRIIAGGESAEDNSWMMLLEGGVKLPLNTDWPLLSGSIAQETGQFSAAFINSIVINPIYGYGKWFHPTVIQEWSVVFLYTLAAHDVTPNSIDAFRPVYRDFLCFIENNLSDFKSAQPMFDEDKFLETYLIILADMKKYMRGEEERSITKETIMTMRSRYAYLGDMYSLVAKHYPRIKNKKISPIVPNWRELINTLYASSNNTKGHALENVAAMFFEQIDGLRISGRRLRGKREEIDLCLTNNSFDAELWKMGALILVECKNWKEKASVSVIRNFSHVLRAKCAHVGVLFARSGITNDARLEIEEQALNGQYILLIDERDLECIAAYQSNPRKMLIQKFVDLKERAEQNIDHLF